MTYVRILFVAGVGILALIGFFGLTGWKERELFSFPLPHALDSFFQTETTGVRLTEEEPGSGLAGLQNRYQELLAKLQTIQHSPQASRMGESGQQRVVDHLSTSVMLAQQSFAEGDAGHALHLLETAYSGWQTAMEDLPVVEHKERGQEVLASPKKERSLQTETSQSAAWKENPAAVPTGENPVPVASFTGQKEITGPNNTESTTENPIQPDTGQKAAGPSGAGDSVEYSTHQPALNGQNQDWSPSGTAQDILSDTGGIDPPSSGPDGEESGAALFVQSNRTVHNRTVSSSRFTRSLAALDALLISLQMDRPNPSGSDPVFERILERREKSVEAHRENDLGEAIRLIELALDEIHLVLQKKEEAFQLSMSVAKKAYESGDVARAESAISSAEILQPDWAWKEVSHWKKLIRQLPLLVQARHDAEQARNAGRLQDERDALMRILALTPENAAAAKRADEITQQISDQQFEQLIGSGHEAVGSGDRAAAESALSEARKLRPSSAELPKLQQHIADLERRQTIAQHLEAARNESARDNWVQALNHYRKILTLDSTHPEAIQGQDFAAAILAAQQGLDDFLARPDRLSSPGIAAAAQAAAEEAKVLGVFSHRLQTAVDALEASMITWQMPVPVRVLSDNETEISIRGIGKVGKTTERIIEVLPGRYLFEGKRKNYRSVLVEVHVKSGQTDLTEVTVICHESS